MCSKRSILLSSTPERLASLVREISPSARAARHCDPLIMIQLLIVSPVPARARRRTISVPQPKPIGVVEPYESCPSQEHCAHTNQHHHYTSHDLAPWRRQTSVATAFRLS